MIGICCLTAPGRPSQPGGGQVGIGVESDLATGAVARRAWDDNGAIIVVDALLDAMPLVDRLAPEHLQLAVDDPQALFDVLRLLDERGWKLVGIYHSHPPGARAEPSPTDIRRAAYPGAVHMIIAPSHDGETLIRRGFLILEGGHVLEVPILIEGEGTRADGYGM